MSDKYGRVWVSVMREHADAARPIRMGDEVVVGSLIVGTVTAADSRDDGVILYAISPGLGMDFLDGADE